jgi:hypothetical protein
MVQDRWAGSVDRSLLIEAEPPHDRLADDPVGQTVPSQRAPRRAGRSVEPGGGHGVLTAAVATRRASVPMKGCLGSGLPGLADRSGRRNRGNGRLRVDTGEGETDDEPGDLLQLACPVQPAENRGHPSEVAHQRTDGLQRS